MTTWPLILAPPLSLQCNCSNIGAPLKDSSLFDQIWTGGFLPCCESSVWSAAGSPGELLWGWRRALSQCTPTAGRNTTAATSPARCNWYLPGYETVKKTHSGPMCFSLLSVLSQIHLFISPYLTEESLNPCVLDIWTNHRPQNLPKLFKLHSTLFISSSVPSTSSLRPVFMYLCSSFWAGKWISQELKVLGAQFLCRTDSTGWITAERTTQQWRFKGKC